MILWTWLACEGEPGGPVAPPPSRVQAVVENPKDVEPPEAFCDTWLDAAHGKPFPAPVLDSGAWSKSTGWRWVNVWATWCGPCVAEMPTLVKWQRKLSDQGVPVELVFLSVDKTRAEVSRFQDRHPGTPPSLLLGDLGTLPEWLGDLGLDASTAIPIHVFVDGQDHVRCIRTGSLGDHHLASVRNLLSNP